MRSFTLDGLTFEYLLPDSGPHENIRSWSTGKYPKITATLPLTGGATVDVYAVADRWNPSHVLVSWAHDAGHGTGHGWPAGNVRTGSPLRSGTSKIPALPRTPAPHPVGGQDAGVVLIGIRGK